MHRQRGREGGCTDVAFIGYVARSLPGLVDAPRPFGVRLAAVLPPTCERAHLRGVLSVRSVGEARSQVRACGVVRRSLFDRRAGSPQAASSTTHTEPPVHRSRWDTPLPPAAPPTPGSPSDTSSSSRAATAPPPTIARNVPYGPPSPPAARPHCGPFGACRRRRHRGGRVPAGRPVVLRVRAVTGGGAPLRATRLRSTCCSGDGPVCHPFLGVVGSVPVVSRMSPMRSHSGRGRKVR